MFAARAHIALRDIRLQAAVRNVTGQMVDGRRRALTDLTDPEGVREIARAIRFDEQRTRALVDGVTRKLKLVTTDDMELPLVDRPARRQRFGL